MPVTPTRPEALEACFTLLTELALAGQQCPSTETIIDALRVRGIRGAAYAVQDLARSGRVVIEVGAQNYRVVRMLDGPAKGRSTALPTDRPWRPYQTVTQAGRIRLHKHRRPG